MAQWGACAWGPRGQCMVMRVAEPAGHRGRVARPRSPDKTAHRLQHTKIEHIWVEPPIACELRRVVKTNPQSEIYLVPVFALRISTRAAPDPHLCSSDGGRNCSMVLPPLPSSSPSRPLPSCH